ncbi:hypothetical protein GSI_12672 [Ganoderma sinense ZZ0214-1]|uniref:Uncharacterized protein n=1 Tax=Ganoderma sinense ZZ0214-1 TaxID=1077348 RepID=A0A2G8RTF1_9APHY|nr:hypothetical protein GSI_12672 [Ganoderma sinense ZZ0214-1]
MPSTFKHEPFEATLARLTAPPPSTPCRTLFPQLQPSVDEILRTLSSTDADVFRSVLVRTLLIYRNPSGAPYLPPLPAEAATIPLVALCYTGMKQAMLDMTLAVVGQAREQPISTYLLFVNAPAAFMFCDPNSDPQRRDDLHFAARAALRFTTAELHDKVLEVTMRCRTSWETFRPLFTFRHTCAAALGPLVDLMPPPAGALGEYAWTWRTCARCANHTGRGRCGPFCADAPWFVELWKQLVAILRARPDPDAVIMWGKEHFARALQEAMACPNCAKVAQEHLRCFEGLLVVEAAKCIAEVPFEL